jgi:hypothetical protein
MKSARQTVMRLISRKILGSFQCRTMSLQLRLICPGTFISRLTAVDTEDVVLNRAHLLNPACSEVRLHLSG